MLLSEKLSSLIQGQFPEFIQTDYPVFTEFVKAYYEWMELNYNPQELIQNTLAYGDIDRTIDEFISYFTREYYENIPQSVLFNKRALVKHITSLYSTKGSSRSYDLLFRLLYDTDVEIFYPKLKVFRASDGKWIRNVSIFVKIIKGSPTDLENKKVIIRNESNTTRYELGIERLKRAENVYGETDVSEFFIDDSTNIPINIGDIIEFEEFKAQVVSTPNQYKIISPGKGFKIGDIIIIKIANGKRSKAKVVKIDSQGGIKALHFVSFGIGYGDLEFYNFFTSKKRAPFKTTYDLTDGNLSFYDLIDRIEDEGWFYKSDYVSDDYFASDYVGEIGRMFREDTGYGNPNSKEISTSLGDGDDAIIMITPGGKAKYPGYYKSNDSFPSDDIYIQDYHYYQPFSYVLRVDEQLKNYKRAVLENIHPAGTKLFAEYLLINDINIPTIVNITKDDKTKEVSEDVFSAYDSKVIDFTSVSNDLPIVDESLGREINISRIEQFSALDILENQTTLYFDNEDIFGIAEYHEFKFTKVDQDVVINGDDIEPIPGGMLLVSENIYATDDIVLSLTDFQLVLDLLDITYSYDLVKSIKLNDNTTKLDITEPIDAIDTDLQISS